MEWLILVVVIALIVDYFIARNCQEIAEEKGHEERGYFWLCFFFGIVGLLIVVALPDRRMNQRLKNIEDMLRVGGMQQPVVPTSSSATQTPVHIQTPIVVDNDENKPVQVNRNQSEIQCPKCGLLQKSYRTCCWKCGIKFECAE